MLRNPVVSNTPVNNLWFNIDNRESGKENVVYVKANGFNNENNGIYGTLIVTTDYYNTDLTGLSVYTILQKSITLASTSVRPDNMKRLSITITEDNLIRISYLDNETSVDVGLVFISNPLYLVNDGVNPYASIVIEKKEKLSLEYRIDWKVLMYPGDRISNGMLINNLLYVEDNITKVIRVETPNSDPNCLPGINIFLYGEYSDKKLVLTGLFYYFNIPDVSIPEYSDWYTQERSEVILYKKFIDLGIYDIINGTHGDRIYFHAVQTSDKLPGTYTLKIDTTTGNLLLHIASGTKVASMAGNIVNGLTTINSFVLRKKTQRSKTHFSPLFITKSYKSYKLVS